MKRLIMYGISMTVWAILLAVSGVKEIMIAVEILIMAAIFILSELIKIEQKLK